MKIIATRPATILPEYTLAQEDDGTCTSALIFPELYKGASGVVHGGVIAMVFDETLGEIANQASKDWWATAYLRVDYRHPSPISRRLDLIIQPAEREGRKCLLRGAIYFGAALCAEAEGLFVKVR